MAQVTIIVMICSLFRSQTERCLLNSQGSSSRTVRVTAQTSWVVTMLESFPGNSSYPSANCKNMLHLYRSTEYCSIAVTVRRQSSCLVYVSNVYTVLVTRVTPIGRCRTAQNQPGDLLNSNNRTKWACNVSLITSKSTAPVVLVYRTERKRRLTAPY